MAYTPFIDSQVLGDMMGLVFVHGVGNRAGIKEEQRAAVRDALFCEYVYPGIGLDPVESPVNAYWGDQGARFRWNQMSLPPSSTENFGPVLSEQDVMLLEHEPIPTEVDMLLAPIAKESLQEAIDLLVAYAGTCVQSSVEAKELAAFAANVSRLGDDPNKVEPFISFASDKELLHVLYSAAACTDPISSEEEFGGNSLRGNLQEGLARIGSSAGRVTGHIIGDLYRNSLNSRTATFFGDVFTYIDNRGPRLSPGPIITQVIDAIVAAKEGSSPLVIVAHSLGGQIVYDILTHYRPDIDVDVLVTVGSQVGLFQELCLLQKAKEDLCPSGPQRLPSLANVKQWINFYDRNDFLSYTTGSIWTGAKDIEYSTGRGIISSHSSYFLRPSFYRALGENLARRS